MGVIPAAFAEESEGYLTLPALKKFAREHKGADLRTVVSRPEIVEDINTFANKSLENKTALLLWLDVALKEGIKDMYIKRLNTDEDNFLFLYDDEWIKSKLEEYIYNPNCRHLRNQYSDILRCFRYDIEDTANGRVITLYMGKLLCFYINKCSKASSYPLIVEIFVDKGLVAGRAKPKANMYNYMNPFILEEANTTTTEKEIFNTINHVLSILGISAIKGNAVAAVFKRMLFDILEKYTQTPKEIVELMNAKNDEVINVRNLIVNQICNLGITYNKDVLYDITNMVEKYFSISYPNKNIFTANREAYPLRIAATDDEDSKLEQRAANEDPLQSKAVFFDNKKLLQKSKLCDGVTFRFFRKSPMYFGKSFDVRISIKADYCHLKFKEYTEEEDIKHVLFSLVRT